MIVAAETALGRRLPGTLRKRLATENGGEVRAARDVWWLYPVWDATNRRTIARTTNHIVRENESLRREWPDMLPPGFHAIADNIGGDHLVIAPDSDDILSWDHETGRLSPVRVNWNVPSSSDIAAR
jgi:hypothetical protein